MSEEKKHVCCCDRVMAARVLAGYKEACAGQKNNYEALAELRALVKQTEADYQDLAEKIEATWLRLLGPHQCWWWSSCYQPSLEAKQDLHMLIQKLKKRGQSSGD